MVTPPDGEAETLQVRPGVFMLVAGGTNVTVQVGKDGVLVVDAGVAGASDQLLRAIRRLSSGPIRFIVTTHSHEEAMGGLPALLKAAGPRVPAGGYGPLPANAAAGAALIAHENVDNRLSNAAPSPAVDLHPTSTVGSERKDLYFNGEPIELLPTPKAHTDGDIIAFFRSSDVISAGGILDTTSYPLVDAAAGGSLEGIIRGLTEIIGITVPERNAMGGTLVIPGRGFICNQIDVVEYRNMLVIIRDRIRDMVKNGMTLEQVKAARPTLDYDGVYGATSGPWTTDMFIETVYRELVGARKTS